MSRLIEALRNEMQQYNRAEVEFVYPEATYVEAVEPGPVQSYTRANFLEQLSAHPDLASHWETSPINWQGDLVVQTLVCALNLMILDRLAVRGYRHAEAIQTEEQGMDALLALMKSRGMR